MLRRRQGELALFAVTALWGTTFLAIADSLASWGVTVLLAARFGLGSLCLLPWLQAAHFDRRTCGRGALLGLLAFVGYALQTLALRFTTQAHCAFGTALVTVFVPLLAALVWRQRCGQRTLLAVVCALVGMAILLGGNLLHGPQRAVPNLLLGDAIALLSAVGFAAQVLLLERYARSTALLPLVFCEIVSVALLSLVAAGIAGEAPPPYSPAAYLPVLYLGACGTAAALVVQVWGQARTSATKAAFIYALEPLFAAVLAWVVAQQPLTPLEMAGGLLVVLSATLAEAEVAPATGAKTAA